MIIIIILREKNMNQVEINQISNRHKMAVKTVTWHKDSHQLFDYEFTGNISRQQFIVSLEPSYVFLYRQNKKHQIIIIKKKQKIPDFRQGEQFVGCINIMLKPHSQKKQFVLQFINASEFQYLPKKCDRIGTEVSNSSGDYRKEDIYFIIRSFKDSQQQTKGFPLKTGQKIKFGRVQYKVTVVKDTDNEGVLNFFQYQQVFNYEENKIYHQQDVCKICLSNEQSEPYTFFCSPCDCEGSCGIVHYDCLLQWCKTKVKKTKHGKITQLNFQKFQCQICKKYFPRFIIKNNKKFDLLPLDQPQKPYLVLGSNSHTTETEKKLIILNYYQEVTPIKIGRNQTCDIKIDDISVSRQHASIETKNRQFFVYDNRSKFGTIVTEPQFSLNLQKIKRGIQIGRTVITFQLEREQQSYIK